MCEHRGFRHRKSHQIPSRVCYALLIFARTIRSINSHVSYVNIEESTEEVERRCYISTRHRKSILLNIKYESWQKLNIQHYKGRIHDCEKIEESGISNCTPWVFLPKPIGILKFVFKWGSGKFIFHCVYACISENVFISCWISPNPCMIEYISQNLTPTCGLHFFLFERKHHKLNHENILFSFTNIPVRP